MNRRAFLGALTAAAVGSLFELRFADVLEATPRLTLTEFDELNQVAVQLLAPELTEAFFCESPMLAFLRQSRPLAESFRFSYGR